MSGTSPEAILYDIGGNVLPVQNATAIPASTPGLLFMGSDGTNSRYITIDSSGRIVLVGAGVAGTPAGGVLSIQGVAGGTVVPTSVTGTVTISGTVTANIGTTGGLALDTSVNGILVAQNSTTSGQTGPLIQGAVTTAAPSYTTAKTSPLSLTTAGALRIDGSAVTQPISGTVTANAGSGNFAVVQATAANLNATVIGTVTANIGTTNGLALDATLTGGTQTTRITDGTNTATVKAASTAAIATDKALVVAISPNNTVGVTGTVTANIGTTNGLALDATLAKLTITQGTALGTNTQALIGGSVTTAAPTYTTGQISPISLTTAGALRIDGSGATQPVSGTVAATQSGTWTVQPGNTANTTPWLTTISQGGNSASVSASNALKVDGSAVTQPVSGTVTANIGTTNGLALDTTLSAQSLVDNAAFTDGTTRVQPAGYILDEVAGTALTENDAAAARIDSKRAQINVIEDATTRGQRLTITASNAMKVDGSAVTQPVSGTITANIGTTNGLALDATLSAQSLVDNAVFTDGTSRVVPSGHIFDEVAGTALTENDVGASRMDSKRAQVFVIEDGYTRGVRSIVKPASTAAVTTDPALVVAISPNNTISVGAVTISQSDITATGSLGALNNNVQVALAGTAGAGMQLVAGTLIGTIVPEISTDGGTTWVAGQFFDPITGVLASSIVFASSNTAQTKTNIITGGASHIRVRVSAYTSGTATCNLRATTANDPSTAIRGTDGAILRTVLLDTSGRIIVAPAGTSATTAGFVNGDVLLSVTGNVVVRRTTLTEQSSNAQRSIVSASANDSSAGTGARTVKITYYDSTGAGPSTETVTMNGTTAVNTASTTICYVEKIEVITVGSTGSNVGAITLKAATAGAGATIMTMNATDNLTYLSIHYVPTGKTCYITGINVGSTSSGIAQGGLYTVRAQNLSGSNNPDKQISDFLYLFGQSSGLTRTYGTPIQVVGPARLQLWVNPFSNNTVTFGGGFDFYEQ